MALFDQISQLMNQSRPRMVQPQGGPNYMGVVEKKFRGPGPGTEQIGEALGSQIGYFFSPEANRRRAIEKYSYLSSLEDDQRSIVLQNPEVQRDLEKHSRWMPELFIRDPIGKLTIAKGKQMRAEDIKLEQSEADVEATKGTESRASKAFPLEQRGREAAIAKTEIDTDKLRQELKVSKATEKEQIAQAGADLEATKASTAYRIAAEDKERAMADYYRRQLQSESEKYSFELKNEEIKQVYQTRSDMSKQLQQTYSRDLEAGPSFNYAISDINQTIAMIQGLGLEHSLSSPVAIQWINQSFNEALRTMGSRVDQEAPDKDMRNLYLGMLELYKSTYANTEIAEEVLSDPGLSNEERQAWMVAQSMHDSKIEEKLRIARIIAYKDQMDEKELESELNWFKGTGHIDMPPEEHDSWLRNMIDWVIGTSEKREEKRREKRSMGYRQQ